MNTHLSWETINDLIDGGLMPAEHAAASLHLQECVACRAELESLQALVKEAHDAPRDAAAPAEAWSAIAGTIERAKSVPLRAPLAEQAGFRISRGRLVAAAAVLIAVTSTLTTLIVRREPTVTVAAGGNTTSVVLETAATREVASVEREYLSTANQLRSALEHERAGLSPATIATVERSLRLIDEAIAEARNALMEDPSNVALRELLRKNHLQKIDFLRRSTALLQKA